MSYLYCQVKIVYYTSYPFPPSSMSYRNFLKNPQGTLFFYTYSYVLAMLYLIFWHKLEHILFEIFYISAIFSLGTLEENERRRHISRRTHTHMLWLLSAVVSLQFLGKPGSPRTHWHFWLRSKGLLLKPLPSITVSHGWREILECRCVPIE